MSDTNTSFFKVWSSLSLEGVAVKNSNQWNSPDGWFHRYVSPLQRPDESKVVTFPPLHHPYWRAFQWSYWAHLLHCIISQFSLFPMTTQGKIKGKSFPATMTFIPKPEVFVLTISSFPEASWCHRTLRNSEPASEVRKDLGLLDSVPRKPLGSSHVSHISTDKHQNYKHQPPQQGKCSKAGEGKDYWLTLLRS